MNNKTESQNPATVVRDVKQWPAGNKHFSENET